MKQRIILLLLFLLLAFAIHAQELIVKTMEVASNDLSASVNPRNDLRGNACALVKVLMVDGIDRVEGNVIGNMEDHGTEKWVYLSAGTKMMKIIPKNHLPLMIMFGDYGIKNVESKVTYTLTLVSTAAMAVSDDGMRYLVIAVEPSHANVLVDGKQQEVKNGTAKVRLSQGTHSYSVSAAGCATKQGTVVIGKEKKELAIKLESAMASLTVTCATEGAAIFVNDEQRGVAPWKGTLIAGDYLIEARKDGFHHSQKSIRLGDNDQQTVALPALKAITGSLDVNYDPVGTEVWLDGKKLGTSPDIFREVVVGNHSLRLNNTGYQQKEMQIEIEEGKTQSVTGSLLKNTTELVEITGKTDAQSSSTSDIIKVKGTVVDKHGYPIIGCSVKILQKNGYGEIGIKKYHGGTCTNIDGQFTLEVPSTGETTLNFSYVGYKTRSVKVNKIKNSELRIVMK